MFLVSFLNLGVVVTLHCQFIVDDFGPKRTESVSEIVLIILSARAIGMKVLP